MQLPIMVNHQAFNTALYVGKNSKKNKKSENNSSALIALDTAFMGHFETYVQKNGQAIRCQFRLENDRIEQLVRANIHKLDSLLREYQYALEAFTFLIGSEPFSLAKKLEEKAVYRSDTVFDAQV